LTSRDPGVERLLKKEKYLANQEKELPSAAKKAAEEG